MSDFELENIEDTLVDGVIQTNKYILVGWNNDSEEIDLQLINDIISNIENREKVWDILSYWLTISKIVFLK